MLLAPLRTTEEEEEEIEVSGCLAATILISGDATLLAVLSLAESLANPLSVAFLH